jgi:hypothetical protein
VASVKEEQKEKKETEMAIKNPDAIRKWTIYKIVTPDGGIYIGKACRFGDRVTKHKYLKSQSNRHLFNSIEKHGWDAHKIEVIEQFESDYNYSEGKEMFWIRTYMSNRNKWPEMNGLNLTDGGISLRGYSHTDDTKAKIGAANAITAKGKKQSKETIEKRVSQARRPVVQYDLNGNFIKEYSSTKEAAIVNGWCVNGRISRVASGIEKTFKGFLWKYKN